MPEKGNRDVLVYYEVLGASFKFNLSICEIYYSKPNTILKLIQNIYCFKKSIHKKKQASFEL
jgi:hypothetical protein